MWNRSMPNFSYSLPNLVDPFIIQSNQIQRQHHNDDFVENISDIHNDNYDKNILSGYLLYDDSLHEGHFGHVRLAIHRSTMVNVVVKIIDKNRFKVCVFFLVVALRMMFIPKQSIINYKTEQNYCITNKEH